MPGRRTVRPIARRVPVAVVSALCLLAATGCVAQPEARPAVMRITAPPWPAPRDAVSYIASAGLQPEPYASAGGTARTVQLDIALAGIAVTVPANIGVDLARAVQAAAHTHDDSGQVTLEGAELDTVTLGQFFVLWGVRFDGGCVGASCGRVEVSADGRRVDDPAGLRLADAREVRVTVDR